ncbi:MAG: site-2 protease family protein [Clostridia bacterium]|nr:site-2 protease family protein [Clostridia bacterium]
MRYKVSLHPLFVIFVCFLACMGWFWVLISYLITIILHELAHYMVSSRKGYSLNQFKLMPHGISLSGSNELFARKDEIEIAIAGPLMNFCLAICGVAIWWLYPSTYVFTYYFVLANVVTGIINLLPIFPLDGGRIALALLSKKVTRAKAMKILRILGVSISFAFISIFVISTFFSVNYTFLVLGIFIFLTAIWEDKTNIYQKTSFLANKSNNLKRGMVIREIAVSNASTLYKIVSQLRSDAITNFKVLNDDLSVAGVINENELEKLIQIYPASTTLKTILS